MNFAVYRYLLWKLFLPQVIPKNFELEEMPLTHNLSIHNEKNLKLHLRLRTSHWRTGNRHSVHFKPLWHVKSLIEYLPDIFILGEALEEWKQNLQKLCSPHKKEKFRTRISIKMCCVFLLFKQQLNCLN